MHSELHDFLRSRRSVREFLRTPVPAERLQRALSTATYAASAHNRQPWRFAVLRSAAAKSKAAEAMGRSYERDLVADGLSSADVQTRLTKSLRRIKSAPVGVLLCCDPSVMDNYTSPDRAAAEHNMAVQSTANAGMLLLLALEVEELGAVWTCAPLFAPIAIRQALHLPKSWEPQALILIGFPAKEPVGRSRRAVEEISVSL